ncbi:MAG: AI-2E family transporter [Gammaproteobacteria bacterium]
MPTSSSFYPRIFALVVAAVLGYALLLIFVPFLGPMTWAAFLAFLLYPLNLRLRRRFRGKGAAAGVLTLLAPIVILLPLSALSIDFVAQISTLLQKLQKSAGALDIRSLSDLQQFPWIARVNVWLEAHAGISAEQIQSWLIAGTREVLKRAASVGGGFFLGALGSLLGFAIMLFLLFFFLRDGDAMLLRARRLIPLDEIRKERLFRQLGGVTRAIVIGTCVTAFVQGVLVGIGFTIAGLPSPVVFGVLAALLAMLPVGGTALVWGPAVIWLFFDGRWGYGIFLLVWGLLLVGTLDNVLRPLLISGRARISALAVFIGVLGGIPAFGAIGLIAGPVVLSLAQALIEFAEEGRAQRS